MCAATLKEHQHGKSRVRLGRTWREGDVHHFVEWNVATMLESDMAHAFQDGSNTDMTATDTQKNTAGFLCSAQCYQIDILISSELTDCCAHLPESRTLNNRRCTTSQNSASRAPASRSTP